MDPFNAALIGGAGAAGALVGVIVYRREKRKYHERLRAILGRPAPDAHDVQEPSGEDARERAGRGETVPEDRAQLEALHRTPPAPQFLRDIAAPWQEGREPEPAGIQRFLQESGPGAARRVAKARDGRVRAQQMVELLVAARSVASGEAAETAATDRLDRARAQLSRFELAVGQAKQYAALARSRDWRVAAEAVRYVEVWLAEASACLQAISALAGPVQPGVFTSPAEHG